MKLGAERHRTVSARSSSVRSFKRLFLRDFGDRAKMHSSMVGRNSRIGRRSHLGTYNGINLQLVQLSSNHFLEKTFSLNYNNQVIFYVPALFSIRHFSEGPLRATSHSLHTLKHICTSKLFLACAIFAFLAYLERFSSMLNTDQKTRSFEATLRFYQP